MNNLTKNLKPVIRRQLEGDDRVQWYQVFEREELYRDKGDSHMEKQEDWECYFDVESQLYPLTLNQEVSVEEKNAELDAPSTLGGSHLTLSQISS